MIHADTETQRITTIRATVTIDVCGLHAYQEEQVAELCTRAAHNAVVDALRQEHEAFRPTRTWDVSSNHETEEVRT